MFKKETRVVLVSADSLMACLSSGFAISAVKPVSDDPENVILDNGQKLLGNNTYPAISYSGHRKIPRSVENTPSIAETKEDLKIVSAMGIKVLRTYNTQLFPHSERILKSIRELKQADPDFEMYVMLGAWIQCKNAFEEGTTKFGCKSSMINVYFSLNF